MNRRGPGDRQAIFGLSMLALCYLAPALLPAVARLAHGAEHAFFAVLVTEAPAPAHSHPASDQAHVHPGDSDEHEHGSIVSGLLATAAAADEVRSPESLKPGEQQLNPHVLIRGPVILDLQLIAGRALVPPCKVRVTPTRSPLVPPPREFPRNT